MILFQVIFINSSKCHSTKLWIIITSCSILNTLDEISTSCRINFSPHSGWIKVFLIREISHFRLLSHNLIIQTGRWHKPKPIPLDQRLCVSYDMSVIESEYHYLLICPRYENLRRVYIPQIYLSERSERDFVELYLTPIHRLYLES